MMKTTAVTLLAILGSALASPAVVWQKDTSAEAGTLRTSNNFNAQSLFSGLLEKEAPESSLASVIFLLGRDNDGTESLSAMAASGALPKVQEKYGSANAIHHHVSGVESSDSVERDVASSFVKASGVLSITLGELDKRLSSKSHHTDEIEVSQSGVVSMAHKHSRKREKALSKAKVLIVNVGARADGATLDAAIAKTIDHDSVNSVVLTAVRSHAEVKQSRMQEHNRRLSLMKVSEGRKTLHGRRLEDADQDAEAENNDDMTGVYYVNMTPNILAGILFGLLFVTIAFTGVSCMNMISGQDVYVKKMPPVGREA